MKKTLTINLGGTVYHIDEDAYHLLDNYLANLRIHFRREEGAEEIVHDMELRISELFADRLNEGKQVITIEDVEEIIARMGKPEELSGEGNGETSGSEKTKGTTIRRLFRDPDNKVLGGVASGLAAYMGWDVTWGGYCVCGGVPYQIPACFHCYLLCACIVCIIDCLFCIADGGYGADCCIAGSAL